MPKPPSLLAYNSPESQRSYRHAIDEFVGWYCSEPRLSFNKTVVTRYRIHLEDRRLAPGTTNVSARSLRAVGGRLSGSPLDHEPLGSNPLGRITAITEN